VAIADVDALVKKDTPIDAHALLNTTSVYTSARIFPMLPDRLCTDLTSLNPRPGPAGPGDRDGVQCRRLAGRLHRVPGARVHNRAKLAYDAVSAWIDGEADLPDAAAAVPGMEAQLRAQDALAQQLRARRHALGSLDLETFQPRALFKGEQVVDIRQQVQNRARQLIEEVMIATNGCTARYLAAQGGALAAPRGALARALAAHRGGVAKDYGEVLPDEPDSKALEAFLAKQHRLDPLRFPDLSLVIVKLMGRGEYVVEDARRRAHRPFRTGGARLHPLHRAQPPVSLT
jgi:exoribonuclease-2